LINDQLFNIENEKQTCIVVNEVQEKLKLSY